MEGQKIAFHDDGEKDVGAVVATLSLGSDAVMDFRRKRGKKDGPQLRATGRMGRVCLRFTLRHADVLVMQGADVQRFYEVRSPLGQPGLC
jgi:alkylated DNA repair dioxygenase AlkB